MRTSLFRQINKLWNIAILIACVLSGALSGVLLGCGSYSESSPSSNGDAQVELADASLDAAENDPLSIQALAASLVSSFVPVWRGPVVPRPEGVAPPSWPVVIEDRVRAISIHCEDVPRCGDHARAALQGAQEAFDLLHRIGVKTTSDRSEASLTVSSIPVHGILRHRFDGGRGGTPGLDLYLARAEDSQSEFHSENWSASFAGRRTLGTNLDLPWDAAFSFATLADSGDQVLVRERAALALLDALLMASDPAEAISARRAASVFLWSQYAVGLSPYEATASPGGALLDFQSFAPSAFPLLLADAVDPSRDDFFAWANYLLSYSRQASKDEVMYRARPNWTSMLEELYANAKNAYRADSFSNALVRVAEQRAVPILSISSGPRRHLLGELNAIERPISTVSRIPTTVRFPLQPSLDGMDRNGLAPSGFASISVPVRPEMRGKTLRFWLRGEYGVRWGFSVVSIQRDGRQGSTLRAPLREVPEAYLPVLVDEQMRELRVVVVNLGFRALHPEEPDDNVRGFRVVVDFQP